MSQPNCQVGGINAHSHFSDIRRELKHPAALAAHSAASSSGLNPCILYPKSNRRHFKALEHQFSWRFRVRCSSTCRFTEWHSNRNKIHPGDEPFRPSDEVSTAHSSTWHLQSDHSLISRPADGPAGGTWEVDRHRIRARHSAQVKHWTHLKKKGEDFY